MIADKLISFVGIWILMLMCITGFISWNMAADRAAVEVHCDGGEE